MGPWWVLAEDIGPKWLYWPWVQDHTDEIRDRLVEHIELTVLAVLFGLAIALPLALLSVRYRRLYGPVLAITGVLYTIPSLALFALLAPFVGRGRVTVLIGLVLYALLVLVRNIVAGLVQVPDEVLDAARGMGYGRFGRLWRVELPLALPGILTGLRLATVSTVALVTVGVLVGHGGLGQLILAGFRVGYRAEITAGTVPCVVLALLLDLLLAGTGRLLMPWSRRAR